MITQLHITALKSIEEITVPCTNLNLLTGANSSGKSTFLQALLLISQNAAAWQGLNGNYVSLGDFRDVKNFRSSANQIVIQAVIDSDSKICLVFEEETETELQRSITQQFLGETKEAAKQEKKIPPFPKIPDICYLSCDRVGALDVYQKKYGFSEIGIHGEYAFHYLQAHSMDPLEQALIRDSSLQTLLGQVNAWLEYIVGTSVAVEDITGTDKVKAAFDAGSGRYVRPRNIGSGVSYLISILILCLSAKKDTIILIENPEIHLHPRAQSRLCEFFCFVAKANRQIFLETHSDHIFNGIRAGIAMGDVKKEEVAINYFELNENKSTKHTKIEIGKNGRIVNYLEGLFDQFDVDMERMLSLDFIPRR